jgi:hypothetical protein
MTIPSLSHVRLAKNIYDGQLATNYQVDFEHDQTALVDARQSKVLAG